MKPTHWIAAGALSAALAVGLGAFGAHGLEERVEASELEIWKTGVNYHFLHAIALVLLGLFLGQREARSPASTGASGGGAVGWCMLLGSLIFAGTLYAMVLGGPRILGAITPIGGLLMIAGWLAFARAALRSE
jgi:uncharacterized membrane protein YgdD (TMEM256/DUF423 family)